MFRRYWKRFSILIKKRVVDEVRAHPASSTGGWHAATAPWPSIPKEKKTVALIYYVQLCMYEGHDQTQPKLRRFGNLH